MKSLILFALLTISSVSFAQSSFIDADESLNAISLVETQYKASSVESGLEASVVKLTDGRMTLFVLSTSRDGYVFLLKEVVTSVASVEFAAKDIIVIKYVQGGVVKSLTLQALRFQNGTLSDSLKILK